MYLGVDGGGTKTALVLIDRDGNIRARQRTTATYFVASGLGAVRATLHAAIAQLLSRASVAPAAVDYAFFGLPGYGEDSALSDALDALPAGSLPIGRFRVGNDMVCGWAGSLAGADGISVVAGTGSISYGERAGLSARCGGWGELFSDEGSAYWIAVRGLELYSRMSDGRLPRGPLYELFKARLALEHDLDLCARIYGQANGERAAIAQHAKLVHEAVLAGDLMALEVFARAAEELAQLVEATRCAVQFRTQETVPVSYSGGVFDHAGALMRPRLAAALAVSGANYALREPLLPPDIGAAVYAARCLSAPLSSTALERLRRQGPLGAK